MLGFAGWLLSEAGVLPQASPAMSPGRAFEPIARSLKPGALETVIMDFSPHEVP